MPLSTISLPRTTTPLFPAICIGCGVKDPGDTLTIGSHAISWWTVALLTFGRRHSIRVPACASCRRRLTRRRMVRIALTVVLAVAAALVAVRILGDVGGHFKKWIIAAVALVLLIPVLLWETFFPPPIDITVYGETIDYEFADPSYARAFAELNGRDAGAKTNP